MVKLATIQVNGTNKAALALSQGYLPLEEVNEQFGKAFPTDVFEIIVTQKLGELKEWYGHIGGEAAFQELGGHTIKKSEAKVEPLYRHPRKIWGIGLNYVEHAKDLSEVAPNTEPASFMKPDTSVIGPKDTILVPRQSERTTAEAELAIVIGQTCKDVTEKDAPNVIAGFTTVIDMTAEDILQKNPRYLTRAKSFDTFFSFGPELVTPDEVEDVHQLTVKTMINGRLHRENVVANMTFRPWHLVSFHSKVMTLLPGDIISTGTPGAVVIRDGDVVACQIDGFEPLVNAVKDLKVTTPPTLSEKG